MRYVHLALRRLMPVALLLLFSSSAVVLTGCPNKKVKKAGCEKDKDCPKKLHCVNRKCQQCAKTAHCAKGQKCKDGACVATKNQVSSGKAGAKKCKKDEDCEDDQDCLKGTCQRPWRISTPVNTKCTLGTVYFKFDQATIAPPQRKTLDDAGDCIKKTKGRDVYVIGHTDPTGTEEYNVALSERRARSVADYLSRLGIDPARMRVIPKGETESTGVHTKDRRVQFEWR